MTNEETRKQSDLMKILPVAVWLLGCALFFTRIGSTAFFSAAPLYQENYPKYFTIAEETGRFIRETGAFWGYDPTFAAGLSLNPGGATISHNLLAPLCALTFLPATVILKSFLLVFFTVFPWLIYLAARRFGLSVFTAGLVMLLDMIANYYSIRYRSIHASMGMYFTAGPVTIYAVSLLARRSSAEPIRPVRTMALMAVFGALLNYWHIEQALLLALAVATHIVIHRKMYFQPKALAAVFLAPVAVLTLSSPWFVPFFRFHRQILPMNVELLRYAGVDWNGARAIVFFLATLLQPISILALILGFAAYRKLGASKSENAKLLMIWVAVIIAISLVSTLNASGTSLYSARFLDLIPFGLFVIAGMRWDASPRLRFSRSTMMKCVPVALLIGLQIFLSVKLNMTPVFRNEPPADYRRLIGWMRENTTKDARIAFESSGKAEDQPLGFDPVSLAARDLDRYFIALPSTESANMVYQAFLYEGRIGTHALADLKTDEIKAVMSVYNIGWIIAVSKTSKLFLQTHSDQFEHRAAINGYEIYSVRREHSYVISGDAAIHAERDRIRLTDATPDENGLIVLAYHFDPCFRADNDSKVLRVESPWDSVGFLAVRTADRDVDLECDKSVFRGLPKGYAFRPQEIAGP